MNRTLFSLAVVGPLLSAALATAQTPNTIGTIERKDPRIDELIPKDAAVEILADGFKWTEGPVWFPEAKHLLFSDIPRNSVFKWTEKDGIELFMKPSGYTGDAPFTGPEPGANGLIRDSQGRLILCQHGDRLVLRIDQNGVRTILASHYDGKRLNSPNDAVFMSNGDLYFTDPPYGLPKRMEDPNKELDFQGVYRVNPRGELTLLTKEMSRPNGIALSPDDKTLYVANSDPDQAIWMAFPVKSDGTLDQGKLIFDATKWVGNDHPGLPDGMKVDQKGNIFATGPGGVWVFAPDGTLLGRIVTGDKTANCAFGDDGSTLYLTINHRLGRLKTTTKGIGF